MASVHTAPATALSKRGLRALKPMAAYFTRFEEGMKRQYDPDTCVDGFILLCVAENKLNFAMAREKLVDSVRAIDEGTAGYCNMRGREGFRSAFARMMTRTVCRRVVDEECLCVSAGVGALLNELAMLLLDPEDGVLLPTPTYAALYNDIGTLAAGVILDMPTDDPSGPAYALTHTRLSAGLEAAMASGHPAKMLLLLNPNNPLGTLYTREELRCALAFCAAHNLHLVSDEIYANSVFDSEAPRFECILDVLADWQEESPETAPSDEWVNAYLHVLWGCSKDFALSGFRVGVLHTRNSALLQALGNVNYFSSVSNFTQDALAAALDDVDWTDNYLAANRRLLADAYGTVTRSLNELDIPYVRACAGMASVSWRSSSHVCLSSCLPMPSCCSRPAKRAMPVCQVITDAALRSYLNRVYMLPSNDLRILCGVGEFQYRVCNENHDLTEVHCWRGRPPTNNHGIHGHVPVIASIGLRRCCRPFRVRAPRPRTLTCGPPTVRRVLLLCSLHTR